MNIDLQAYSCELSYGQWHYSQVINPCCSSLPLERNNIMLSWVFQTIQNLLQCQIVLNTDWQSNPTLPISSMLRHSSQADSTTSIGLSVPPGSLPFAGQSLSAWGRLCPVLEWDWQGEGDCGQGEGMLLIQPSIQEAMQPRFGLFSRRRFKECVEEDGAFPMVRAQMCSFHWEAPAFPKQCWIWCWLDSLANPPLLGIEPWIEYKWISSTL